MKKAQRNKTNIKNQIREELAFLKDLVSFLALSFQEQYARSSLPEDIIADDTAENWDFDFISGMLSNLYKKEIIDKNNLQLFKKICNNFGEVSLNGGKFEQAIWTIEGMEKHPFWEQQRQLARKLLEELNKIKL